jgi:protoheme IX farnesyltransferase
MLLSVTKPGIIFGNLITVTGGYFLGAEGHGQILTYLATIVGISLIIACGCVFNNFIDRDIDKLMERTKNRPSAQGLISGKHLILFAVVLGVFGTLDLFYFTNILTMSVALVGLFFYVVVYTLWAKRRSVYGTLVGSISGAIPPVVGYCAATNQLDLCAALLFIILCFWQMPHSYAIGIFRLKDYTAAGIPLLPVKKGIARTKISMMLYIVGFIVVATLPTVFGYTGVVYLVFTTLLGVTWFVLGLKGFKAQEDGPWAKKMFFFSLIIIMAISFLMSI